MKVRHVHVAGLLDWRFGLTAVSPAAAVLRFVLPPRSQREVGVEAGVQLEVCREVGDFLHDKANDAVRALHAATASHHGGGEDRATVPPECRGPDYQVGVSAFCLRA